MSWSDRLLRLAVGDPKREVVEPLLSVHQRATAQVQRLSAAAAQAPTAGAEHELRSLAAQEGELAAAVALALQDRGAAPAAASSSPPELNGATHNHWARLVEALEACRQARANLLRATPHLLELDAGLAGLLRAALHGLDAEVLALRSLIARADPQALD